MRFEEFSSQFYAITSDILQPLSEIAWAIKEDDEPDPDILDDLFISFWVIGETMCGSDGKIHRAEAEIISALEQLFPDKEFTSPEIVHKISANRSLEQWEAIERLARCKPKPLSMLQAYDKIYGTSKADALRQLYLNFALIIAKADGNIKNDESNYLQELKEILYRETFDDETEDIIPSARPSESKPELEKKNKID